MIESDRSETEDGDMDRLQLSSDSIDSVLPKKRLRVEDSEDEIDLPVKRQRNSLGERSKMLKNDNIEIVSEKNTDRYNVKEEGCTLCPENEQSIQKISESDMNKKKQDDGVKQENENKSILDENNFFAPNKNPEETNIKEEVVDDMVIM